MLTVAVWVGRPYYSGGECLPFDGVGYCVNETHQSDRRLQVSATERTSSESVEDSEGMKGTEPDEQVVGDDESDYGGAGAGDAEGADRVDPGGENRPASDEDEDQGI